MYTVWGGRFFVTVKASYILASQWNDILDVIIHVVSVAGILLFGPPASSSVRSSKIASSPVSTICCAVDLGLPPSLGRAHVSRHMLPIHPNTTIAPVAPKTGSPVARCVFAAVCNPASIESFLSSVQAHEDIKPRMTRCDLHVPYSSYIAHELTTRYPQKNKE